MNAQDECIEELEEEENRSRAHKKVVQEEYK
jgi:hypothetical protein